MEPVLVIIGVCIIVYSIYIIANYPFFDISEWIGHFFIFSLIGAVFMAALSLSSVVKPKTDYIKYTVRYKSTGQYIINKFNCVQLKYSFGDSCDIEKTKIVDKSEMNNLFNK